jgi:hypothetical protein
MNYTEKVNQQVKAILEPFEEKLLEEVKKMVLESFKNGIDVGKQRKSTTSKEAENNNQDKEE